MLVDILRDVMSIMGIPVKSWMDIRVVDYNTAVVKFEWQNKTYKLRITECH